MVMSFSSQSLLFLFQSEIMRQVVGSFWFWNVSIFKRQFEIWVIPVGDMTTSKLVSLASQSHKNEIEFNGTP